MLLFPMLAISFFLLLGCRSMDYHVATQPTGQVSADYLEGDKVPSVAVANLKEALTRSESIFGWLRGARVEVVLQTVPLQLKKSKERILNEAQRYKHSSEKVQTLLKESRERILDRAQKEVCFEVLVQTDDGMSLDEKAWHGQVSQAGQSGALTFTKFVGYRDTTRTLRRTGNLITSNDYNRYTLLSFPCAPLKLTNQADVDLVIEPRFREGIKPLNFKWQVVQGGDASGSMAGSCPSGAKVSATPMQFRGFAISCVEDCRTKIHKLNQATCEANFARHLKK